MNWLSNPEVMAVWMVSAAVFTLFLALVLVSRRSVAALWAAALLGSIAWWQALYAAELLAGTPALMQLFDQLQFLGIGALPVTWLAYASHTTGHSSWVTPRWIIAVSLVPAAVLLLALTNGVHGLVWPSVRLVEMGGVLARVEVEGPVLRFMAVYTYAALGFGAVLLGQMMVRDPSRRWPGMWLLLGIAMPSFAYILEIFGVLGEATLDLTPLGLAFSGLVVAWVVFSVRGRALFSSVGVTAFNRTGELVFMLDDDDRVLHLNPAAAALTGLDAREARGRPLYDVWPRWAELPREELGETSTEVELSASGERQWFAISRTLQQTPEAGPRGSVVVARDITAQRSAERVLAQSEARFRLLFESAPDAFLLVQPEGRVLDCNRGAEELLSSPQAHLVGRSLYEAAALEGVEHGVLQRLLEVRPGGPVELDIGGEREAEVRTYTVRSDEADLVLVMARDITGRRERQEAIGRARETRAVRNILESSPDQILVVGAKGLVVDCNTAAVEIHGLESRDALVGECFVDLLTSRDREPFSRALESASTKDMVRVEATLVAADGELVPVDLSLGALRRSAGSQPGVVVVAKDTRQQRSMAARLAQSDRLASVGLLAAGVAHGINNPLAYVHGNLEHLRDLLAGYSSALECVEDCLDGTERIRAIVRDLQPYTRVQEEELAAVDVEAILEQTIHLTANELRVRGMLHREFEGVPTVRGSAGRLGQVFLNLVLNSLQAMGETGGTHVLTLRTREEGEVVVVEVTDTGAGIPADDLPRVFEPYFSTRDPSESSGLGLWVCRNVVDQCGGTIELSSGPRGGTTARVRLPVMFTDEASAASPPAVQAAAQVRPRILVVDDEPMVRRVLERRLRRDHEVTLAASGGEAQDVLREDSAYHMILCDLLMPGLSGPDLYAWATDEVPHLAGRMVFMTGGAFTREAEDFLRSLPLAHLDKPLDMSAVEELARRLAAGEA